MVPVAGHFVLAANGRWTAAEDQSSALFNAVVRDDVLGFEAALAECPPVPGTGWDKPSLVLYWRGEDGRGGPASSSPVVEAKSRSMMQVAVQQGSLRVLAAMLASGCDPRTPAADGTTAYAVRIS